MLVRGLIGAMATIFYTFVRSHQRFLYGLGKIREWTSFVRLISLRTRSEINNKKAKHFSTHESERNESRTF